VLNLEGSLDFARPETAPNQNAQSAGLKNGLVGAVGLSGPAPILLAPLPVEIGLISPCPTSLQAAIELGRGPMLERIQIAAEWCRDAARAASDLNLKCVWR
jgi:hypothetical protein